MYIKRQRLITLTTKRTNDDDDTNDVSAMMVVKPNGLTNDQVVLIDQKVCIFLYVK